MCVGLLPEEQVKFSRNSKFIPETEFPTHWNGTQFRDYIRKQFPKIGDFDFFRGEGNKSELVKIEESVCPKTFGLHFKRSKIYIIPKASIKENNCEVSMNRVLHNVFRCLISPYIQKFIGYLMKKI